MVQLKTIKRCGLVSTRAICCPGTVHILTEDRLIAPNTSATKCHNITGTIEYLLRVECADLPSYKTFHTDVLGTLPHVTSITSYVVMGSPKDIRA